MEAPQQPVLGIVDDAWFHCLCDFGNAGDDKGKGGKYLLVPPDYDGRIPEGYIVKKSRTYGHWLAMRGSMTNFDAAPVVKPPVGAGSQYVIGLRDADGLPLDGNKTYRIHVPPNVPAKRFWDITVYDNQTRSLLQTDNPYPGVTSIDSGTTGVGGRARSSWSSDCTAKN